MKKPDGWMPFDVRAYLGDTLRLTRDQHGGYVLLILDYWMRGTALDDDDGELAAITKASPADWKKLRPVLLRFFTVRDGKWFHKRVEHELERARGLIEAKSKAGSAGAEARWQTHGRGNADANGKRMAEAITDGMAERCRTDAPSPSPSPVVPQSAAKKTEPLSASADASVRYSTDFEAFWRDYPTDRLMSKKAAFGQWKRLGAEDRKAARAGVPGFRAYCASHKDYRAVHAERFLSERRFDGFNAPEATAEQHPVHASWNGSQSKLVSEIGEGAFNAYFAEASFDAGPPAHIGVAKAHLRDLIERKFAGPLKRAFEDVKIVVTPPHVEQHG